MESNIQVQRLDMVVSTYIYCCVFCVKKQSDSGETQLDQ